MLDYKKINKNTLHISLSFLKFYPDFYPEICKWHKHIFETANKIILITSSIKFLPLIIVPKPNALNLECLRIKLIVLACIVL